MVGVVAVGDADVDVGLGAVVAVVAVGVAVSVGSVGCWDWCERAVRISAPATTSARKPMLITLAATRLGGLAGAAAGGSSVGVVGTVISGSYGGTRLLATRAANR